MNQYSFCTVGFDELFGKINFHGASDKYVTVISAIQCCTNFMIKLQEIPRYLVKLAAVLMLLYSDSHVSYTHIPQFSPFFFLTGENVVSIFINLLTNARSSFQQAYKVPDCIIPRKRRKIQEPIFLTSSFLKKKPGSWYQEKGDTGKWAKPSPLLCSSEQVSYSYRQVQKTRPIPHSAPGLTWQANLNHGSCSSVCILKTGAIGRPYSCDALTVSLCN